MHVAATEQLLARVGAISERARTTLHKLITPRSFETDSFLLKAGDQACWCFFIVRGLVRELYIDEHGQEHTRTFVAEQQLTGSLLDLISGKPSITWIQALEPTQTLQLSYRALDALSDDEPAIQKTMRHFAEQLYVRKAQREHDMLALSAGERYARWLRDNAQLDARIQRRHLASYLGVTPEHLSRLKREAR